MTIISQFNTSKKIKFNHLANNSTASTFIDLLNNKRLKSIFEKHSTPHRKRIYTPSTTLSMFLAQVLNEDRSCSKAVNDLIIQQPKKPTYKISNNTGAFCLARKKLSLDLLIDLTIETGSTIQHEAQAIWGWKNRRVCLIDGTSLTMPDTKESQQVFPQQGAQKPGLGFPICRLLTVNCLTSGAVLNAAISAFKGKGTDEQSLLRKVLGTFKRGDVVIGDAFFGTYFLLVEMLKKGVDVLFEQMGVRKKITDFGKGTALGKKDHLIEIPKSKKKPDWMTQNEFDEAPEKIVIRELRVDKKVLITTMLSAKEYPKKALKNLYKQRWDIETDFRDLKTTLGMNILSCKSPDMCIKEIWAHFLANNFIRLLMAQAAQIHNLQPREISFKCTVQIWSTYNLLEKAIDEELFILIANRKVRNRPGRIEPRAVKRRPKAYKLLMTKRHEARENVMKNGHPVKIK